MTSHPTDKRSVQERLRFLYGTHPICTEAADRIDALERALGDVLNAVENRAMTMRVRKIMNAARSALHPSDEEVKK